MGFQGYDDGDYDGYNEFMDIRKQRATKAYTCYMSRRTIHPGEEYYVIVYKYEGEFGWYRVCTPAYTIMNRYNIWSHTLFEETLDHEEFVQREFRSLCGSTAV